MRTARRVRSARAAQSALEAQPALDARWAPDAQRVQEAQRAQRMQRTRVLPPAVRTVRESLVPRVARMRRERQPEHLRLAGEGPGCSRARAADDGSTHAVARHILRE